MDNRELNLSYCIPEEIRRDVAETMDATDFFGQISQHEMDYFFEIYNRYIAPPHAPEDITCFHCRSKVIRRIKSFVQQWKEHGYEQGQSSA